MRKIKTLSIQLVQLILATLPMAIAVYVCEYFDIGYFTRFNASDADKIFVKVCNSYNIATIILITLNILIDFAFNPKNKDNYKHIGQKIFFSILFSIVFSVIFANVFYVGIKKIIQILIVLFEL